MEEISSYQAMQLALDLLDFVGVQFQYWLAMTFALIVATYTTAGKMNWFLKLGVGLLYVLSSFLFIWIYLDAGADYLKLSDLLESRGVDLIQHHSWVTGAVRVLIWAIGSIVALAYLFFGERRAPFRQPFGRRTD